MGRGLKERWHFLKGSKKICRYLQSLLLWVWYLDSNLSFFCVQQLRTVVAENLPDDHSHQNIEKIFNVAGWFVHFLISLLHPFNSLPLIFFINSVKTIRICHPQDPSTRSKVDSIISTKVNRMHIYVYIIYIFIWFLDFDLVYWSCMHSLSLKILMQQRKQYVIYGFFFQIISVTLNWYNTYSLTSSGGDVKWPKELEERLASSMLVEAFCKCLVFTQIMLQFIYIYMK